ncbi:hypothetical protein BG011_009173 [Mortierella polycephala]|uniref:Superoxide dismutase copper/zinc binding domain-containing protein n=1 Tax=Mortierella polycephala TaxID=41804 RepID=A0A9P6QDG4_9FUNG|nr:hypothetical protein BG011_009173 [Mortierella polycephala]
MLVSSIDMNGIRANFVFAPLNGKGAQVLIEVQSGLKKQFAKSPSGGFEYHIHEHPVGPNNDCMATGGHLDPANVGSAKCNSTKPELCQEGDLSGKHGEFNASDSGATPTIAYIDRQLQFSGAGTTIEGRSIVIHNNGTRVACGNLLPMQPSTTSSNADMDKDVDTKTAQYANNGQSVASGLRGALLVALGVMALL